MNRMLVLAMLVCSCCGCAPGYFYMSLSDVDRPPDAVQRYGAASLACDPASGRLSFEDSLIWARMEPTEDRVAISLRNKTARTIKILWDASAFVGIDGVSARVMHANVRYLTSDAPKPPSVVPAKSSLEDVVLPVDRVTWNTAFSKWTTLPLILTDPHTPMKDYIGKRICLLLTIEDQGRVNEYTFWFSITGYHEGEFRTQGESREVGSS